MRRLFSLTLALLLASTLVADDRIRPTGGAPQFPEISEHVVSGVVSSITGSLIQLAGGLVTIDATGASIVSDAGSAVTLAAITPGSLVFATLKKGDVAANAALPATTIGVVSVAQVSLSGAITAIDATRKTLTVLGRTIVVTASTTFIGGPFQAVRSFSDLLVNEVVAVHANNVGGALQATSVQLLSAVPQQVTTVRGTVKSMSSTAWVVTSDGRDVTVTVNAQTKIAGSPIVGDSVEIIASRDSAANLVAISIVKTVSKPAEQVRLSGTVKSIAATAWVVTSEGKDTSVAVNAQTKIDGAPKVGDKVVVVATTDAAKNLTAVSITKESTPVPVSQLRGVVKTISTTAWVITSDGRDISLAINSLTKISGDPKAGDTVEVTALADSAGKLTAVLIVKSSVRPPAETRLRGVVKSISTTAWVITVESRDVSVTVNAQTKITGDPKVGDRVDVVTQQSGTAIVAVSISKVV